MLIDFPSRLSLINHFLFCFIHFQYALLLILVFLLEFSVGAVTYVYESQVDDELLASLNKTFMSKYGVDETQTKAIDLMQQSVRLLFFIHRKMKSYQN